MDDLACMLGVLPNCFRLNVSEADRAGHSDYIIQQGDIDLPSSEELLKITAPEGLSKKLQIRQLAFHCALLRIYQKDQSSTEDQKTFRAQDIPRYPVESIHDLQKKQLAKNVLASHQVCTEEKHVRYRHKNPLAYRRTHQGEPQRKHA